MVKLPLRILLVSMLSLVCAYCLLAESPATAEEVGHNWAQWRGPLGTGVAQSANPPVRWDEQENVRWKVELPGLGHSTPIVWGDRLFVTTAIPAGERFAPRHDNAPGSHDNLPVTQRHQFVLLAVNRINGEILWQRTVRSETPHEGGHYTGSLASASSVTDGRRVVAYFGSRGLYCLDMDGKMLWDDDLGIMHSRHAHGEGSSPALYGHTLVVNWDHEGASYLVAFDIRDGRQLWKVDRDEVTSWSSPIVVDVEGRPQVIVSGTQRVRGYDLGTGDVIWECGGLSRNIVATPVAAGGMVYVASSYDTRAMLAIRLAGPRGDVTDTDHVVWSRMRGTPYVPSPLLYGDSLYFLRHYQNILTRVVAASGEQPVGPVRLDGLRNIYASPVGAAGRIYVTDTNGATLVLSHGTIPRILALNQLDDSFSASAAIVGDALYLRGRRFLYCLAAESE
tara:strand:+ start:1008 stop:2357 length:1350 start_codon:yes stop_codon:yes gene_type:complete